MEIIKGYEKLEKLANDINEKLERRYYAVLRVMEKEDSIENKTTNYITVYSAHDKNNVEEDGSAPWFVNHQFSIFYYPEFDKYYVCKNIKKQLESNYRMVKRQDTVINHLKNSFFTYLGGDI